MENYLGGTITYYFEYNGDIITHKGGLKNMATEYEISFYQLKRLRYGIIDEYNGWKFLSIENNSFKPFIKNVVENKKRGK